MVPGCLELFGKSLEKETVRGFFYQGALSVHEFFRIAYGATENLTDGLMAQADAEDRNLAFQLADGFLADACVRRSSGAGGEDQRFGSQGAYLVDRDFIVSHHLDLRVDTSDELVKVIGKTVVILNQ